MSFWFRATRALHRLLLRTAATPLSAGGRLAYRITARAWAAYLARGEPGAATYVRGSVAGGEALPGLSDIDVAIVLEPDPRGPGVAASRTIARWTRLRRSVPAADLLLDYPLILERDELHEVAEDSALTLGLEPDGANGAAAYFGKHAGQSRTRLLERPGLYSSTASWRLLSGPDARPAPRPRDRGLLRVAAWLELCAWWQWAFPACADPSGPRTASLCVKLISEPVRVWLWLAHGLAVGGRAPVLALGLERLPEERHALELASALQRSLARSPQPPLGELLPATVRISSRIAALLAVEVGEAGVTEVVLRGTPERGPEGAASPELILPQGRWRPTPALAGGERPWNLPLCDWRTLTDPSLPDECFALLTGDPGDPIVLGAATSSQPTGPYPALRADGLLVLPAERARARLRALKSEVSDPVSFALLERRAVARFPDVRGFSAQDAAARGLAEHRAWLRTRPGADRDRPGSAEEAGGRELGMLLSAARVAVFADSLRAPGGPELPLTLAATTAALAARSPADRTLTQDALGHYRAFADYRTPPPARMLSAVRRLVEQLPGYA